METREIQKHLQALLSRLFLYLLFICLLHSRRWCRIIHHGNWCFFFRTLKRMENVAGTPGVYLLCLHITSPIGLPDTISGWKIFPRSLERMLQTFVASCAACMKHLQMISGLCTFNKQAWFPVDSIFSIYNHVCSVFLWGINWWETFIFSF